MSGPVRDKRLDTWGLTSGDALSPDLTAVRLLGGGTSYEAWLAFDEVTLAPVVVKMLRPSRAGDAADRRSLRREADALAAANHPVVVRGLRFDETGPRPHLVLEQADGPRLSTLVRRYGALQPQQYLPLAIDLASALHYFRHIGYVHLDVKPSNVIMGAPARLIDLSVARPVQDAEAIRTPVGTDAWMSPEQCRPTAEMPVGTASDVWGLGATLFFAVTGTRPYDGVTVESGDTDHPQLTQRPRPLPSGLPDEVVQVLESCLAHHPGDRPTPREVSEALEPALERQPAMKLSFRARG